jgi:hypothetical protein
VEQYGVRSVFGITALFPLIVSVAAVLIQEQPQRAGYQPLPEADSGSGDGADGGPLVLLVQLVQLVQLGCLRWLAPSWCAGCGWTRGLLAAWRLPCAAGPAWRQR